MNMETLNQLPVVLVETNHLHSPLWSGGSLMGKQGLCRNLGCVSIFALLWAGFTWNTKPQSSVLSQRLKCQ